MIKRNKFLLLVSAMLTFVFCLQCPVAASTIVDNPNSDDNMKYSPHLTHPPRALYHTRSLDFREHTLEANDVHLLTNGNYEEVDLASTNIKKYGLGLMTQSQASLLELDLDDNGLVDSDVSSIVSFANLQRLSLNKNLLKDSCLEGIGNNLGKLRELNIQYNLCTPAGISFLRRLNQLDKLDCSSMKLGNEGICYIVQMGSLRQLFVQGTGFDNAGLMSLLNLPLLEVVNISYNKISPQAVETFKAKTKARIIALHMIQ
jgi:hypothetical protein